MRDGKYAEDVTGLVNPMNPDYSEWQRQLSRPRPGLQLVDAVTELFRPVGRLIDGFVGLLMEPQRHVERARRFCEGRDAAPDEIAMVRYHPEDK